MKKRSHIQDSPLSKLVAARVQPRRRPPAASFGDREGFFLRISHAPPAADGTADADAAPADGALRELARIGETLIFAQRSLRRIMSHMDEARERIIQIRAESHRADGRRSPLQARLQAALDAIELIAHTARMDDRPILDGTGAVALPTGVADACAQSPLLRLPSCLLNCLGDAKSGYLAQLRRPRIPTNLAETILRSARNQVERQLQIIEAWLRDALMPAIQREQVATESRRAARSARDDADFVDQLGGLTPLHALAASAGGRHADR